MRLTQETVLLLWLAGMACVAAYLTSAGLLLSYLRKRHNHVWVGLGSPSFFVRNSPYTTFKFLKFFLLRRYKSLNDPAVENFFRVIWPTFVIGTLIILALMALAMTRDLNSLP